MKKQILFCVVALSLCLAMGIAMLWQHQKIKKELIRDFALEHGVVEYSLREALNEYEASGNQSSLSDSLYSVQRQVHRASDWPRITQLNGTEYTETIPYLEEIGANLDFSLHIVLGDAALSARHGTLTDRHLQELSDYSTLFTDFTKDMITKDFEDKSLSELEKSLASFYLGYEQLP
ncbi:hypothetical protein [Domibacillus enclensis]|uniref:Uncharacterized protein n=1 Tax=Domibacillus enclensis TaxID=1017273 RepID=A0A1N6XY39_9BACI|nr:hypothetical protein [Domibacillus enclensis]OXS77456.1 hypothetical protein B1B05_11510 [Domibacillus enclensis]SIR07206.1 hypothetical protein SAMN05443094_10588 [Domibacillus enclensis]